MGLHQLQMALLVLDASLLHFQHAKESFSDAKQPIFYHRQVMPSNVVFTSG